MTSAELGFAIGDRVIGADHATFVIAEAGVNHNGRLDLALQLVDAAADAGADAVKFQTWVTDLTVTRSAPLAPYQRRAAAAGQAEMLRALELRRRDLAEIKRRADARGIVFLSTPDEIDSAHLLVELGVPAIKIGSGDVDNIPFLREIATLGLPVILSTGMADLDEVREAVGALEARGCRDIALLHCVSAYPAPPSDANLAAMTTLREAFARPVGFSDHTRGLVVPLAAVAMGACIIEKHLTLDRGLPGPDHAASAEPGELADLVRAIRTVEAARGSGEKRVAPSEQQNRAAVRKVLVAARALPAGHTLSPQDLLAKRAGAGLPPRELDRVIGRSLVNPLHADQPLALTDLR